MTEIIISFDTEEYTSNRAADGIVDAANLLREEGIRGCFCIVGMLAEQLAAWGREDVREALKYHDVEFHSYRHTMHPTINEYTNIEDFQAAYEEFFRREAPGLDAVRAFTGTSQICAAVPPGPCESYVASYAYHDLGLNCHATEIIDTPGGRLKYFCNNLAPYYYTSFEDIVEENRAEDLSFYEKMAAREHVVIYSHANRWIYRDFADCYNFDGENRKPEQWQEADPMTEGEMEHFREEVRKVLRALKNDERFHFTTYKNMIAEHCSAARIVKREDMIGIREQLKKRFYPVEYPVSLCISDIFAAAVMFLRGNREFAAGRVYGFLEEPYGISEPVIVTAEAVREAAAKVRLDTFLPVSFDLQGIKIGPADFLYAMLEVLGGEERAMLVPRTQNIDLSEFNRLADPPLSGWLFPKEFRAEILKKRMPLQAWTIRYV